MPTTGRYSKSQIWLGALLGTSALRNIGTRQLVDSLYPVAGQVICNAKKLRSYLLAEFIKSHIINSYYIHVYGAFTGS